MSTPEIISLPEVMPLKVAAEILDVHPRTLQRNIGEGPGQLRASQLTKKGNWIVQADDLREFLDARANRHRRPAAPAAGDQLDHQDQPEPAHPGEPRRPRARRRRAQGGLVVIDPSWGKQ